MKNLVIIGASGHGAMCADAALLAGIWHEIVFSDDNAGNTAPFGLKLIGTCEDVLRLPTTEYEAFIAIGNPAVRMKLLHTCLQHRFTIANIIHPSAVISRDVQIGQGTVLAAQAVINPRARLGMGCIINTGATVDHDCVLEDGVHISVGAHLAGTVTVGAHTWVGIGASLSNNVSICGGCMLGAGTVVVKDITEPGTYVGVPAKRIG